MVPRLALISLLAACASPEDPASEALDTAFSEAATDYRVPRDLLVSVSYALTRLDQRAGEEAVDSGVGLMNLRSDGGTPSLQEAAEILGLSVDDLATEPVPNIRGGAAMLAGLARQLEERTGEPIDTLQEWYPIVATFSGAADPIVAEGFASQVFDFMELGFVGVTPDGQWLVVEGQPMPWREGSWMATSGSSVIDQYVPASGSNYTNDSRGPGSINTIVIHTTEGSYSGAISWFQNSSAQVSAHYVVRSSDGQITQMVDEEDIAWHAGDWSTNQASIGIEHEGYVSAPETWYTESMYQSSAALVSDICDRYGIPKDRSHIIGHNEVPGCSSPNGGGSGCHTDPGSGWDWDYFMSLVQGGSTSVPSSQALADGPKTGHFEAELHSSRGKSDTCSGPISGSASGGMLYLTGTCGLDTYGSQVAPVQAAWSGKVSGGTALETKVAVEGYADNFTGAVNADGSVAAEWSGSHELGGDVGTLTYTARITVEP